MLRRVTSYPLGKITSWGSAEDVPNRRPYVRPHMVVPTGPLCNAKGRPLPTSWGRPLLTSSGRWNFLQTFIAIEDDMTLCQFVLSLASQMPILITGLAVSVFYIWALPVNKMMEPKSFDSLWPWYSEESPPTHSARLRPEEVLKTSPKDVPMYVPICTSPYGRPHRSSM